MEPGARRHLVLVGGGHAHVAVLRSLVMRPEPGLRMTLVSPRSYATYSGMVPGVIAGQYPRSAAAIDLRALSAAAGAAFLADRAIGIEAERRLLQLAERPPLAYDLLSLDVGSEPRHAARAASGSRVLAVKPIEAAAEGILAALAEPPPPAGRRIVIVGAGAGGVEIAFALAAMLRREGRGSITLCDRSSRPLGDRHPRTSRLVEKVLDRLAIAFLAQAEVDHLEDEEVVLTGGRRLPATLVVWATGASGPEWLARSGLATDERGFLPVGDDLRCREHPEIFAAGDCATLASNPDLPKAGVYAVRQGPVLAHNLRLAARGFGRLKVYTPQRRFLSLLNTGDGKAILSYGRLALRGRLAWRLKNHIDRRFIARYARPRPNDRGAMRASMLVCGGCAAKMGADVLRRVLARLELPVTEGLIVGLRDGDDAAVFVQPPGTLAVATIDAFPPFSDDLFLVGQVAAVNAASDLYAMGAEGTAAIALACLAEADERHSESDLEQLLGGAGRALAGLGIPLAGGHTIAGEQLLFGFAMHGAVEPERILRKTGARPGDRLVLTKPLGTGVVLAAARAGFAPAEWVEAAHASMLRSNGPAMRLLRNGGARACTDVTGFGLAGHLGEMLEASGAGAVLDGRALPRLRGAVELLEAGWRSSFHAQNARAAGRDGSARIERELMIDPQTSGGLLASVPSDRLVEMERTFAAAGEELYVIGEIVPGPPQWRLQSDG